MIDLVMEQEDKRPRIKVIGVGGAGGNAVANMIRSDVHGVDFVVANTDGQALRASPAATILQLGRFATQGLGAGSVPEIGRIAAEESLDAIDAMLDGADMCFIAAGMGGGTGTGAAPIIAKAARARSILTVAVVTKPFAFEGRRRAAAAEAGLEALQREVDTLIVIPNQNLFRIAGPATTMRAAFDLADEVLQQGVRGITDLMVMPGLINLDFADVRTIMLGMGRAMMGTAEAGGDDRAIRAAAAAIANPLLDEAIRGARGLIISITGGEDMGLMEVDEAASHIKEQVDPDADIIWGSAFDPALAGRIRVSVVATGIDTAPLVAAEPAVFAVPPPPPAIAPASAPAQPMLVLEPPEEEPLLLDAQMLAPEIFETPLVDAAPAEAPDPSPATLLAAAPVGLSLFERMAMAARISACRRLPVETEVPGFASDLVELDMLAA